MAEFRSPFVPGLPRFTGGAVGYLGYDAASWFEPALAQTWHERGRPAAGDEDEAGFMLFDTVLAFDHVKHRILIIANARITADEDLESLYQFACAKIEFLERELERSLSQPSRGQARPRRSSRRTRRARRFEAQRPRRPRSTSPPATSTRSVLSQRFEADVAADPFTVYRALRHVNPSPYMYFIRMGGARDRRLVAGDAGARRRARASRRIRSPARGRAARNEEEDLRLAEELKRNEKERAEHVMLVDLGRNDVGRVCEYGIGARAAVHGARALLARHAPGVDRRRQAGRRIAIASTRWSSCFPAGTVSGAPKVRAMQIIAELEPTRRGIYAGAVGYLDFAGNLDFCIAIRTIMIRGRRRPRPGRRRHRRRLESGGGVRGDARQGAGAAAARSTMAEAGL